METSKTFFAKVFGDRALITTPESKSGGEKISYQIPTWEMLRGILDANYFKPTICNIVDEVRVINKIESYTQGTRLLLSDYSSGLSAYTYLSNVIYYVKYHFEWNLDRKDLEADRNFKKHEAITERSLKRGGRMPIFLGVSECLGYIEELTETEYEQDPGYYDATNLSFGIMFNGFIYPKEPNGVLVSTYAPMFMKNGRITYLRPEDAPIRNELNSYSFKRPSLSKSVEEELSVYGAKTE